MEAKKKCLLRLFFLQQFLPHVGEVFNFSTFNSGNTKNNRKIELF